ncbi:hypothetical protein K440DRAFT_620320 [Wilcoxina mikolae CBS 423.85]|nr:hypothetical protein K440DRAFT_620320 [Wilcoxina mikolae CBS 423.85]
MMSLARPLKHPFPHEGPNVANLVFPLSSSAHRANHATPPPPPPLPLHPLQTHRNMFIKEGCKHALSDFETRSDARTRDGASRERRTSDGLYSTLAWKNSW